jgi:hypothetical protein
MDSDVRRRFDPRLPPEVRAALELFARDEWVALEDLRLAVRPRRAEDVLAWLRDAGASRIEERRRGGGTFYKRTATVAIGGITSPRGPNPGDSFGPPHLADPTRPLTAAEEEQLQREWVRLYDSWSAGAAQE